MQCNQAQLHLKMSDESFQFSHKKILTTALKHGSVEPRDENSFESVQMSLVCSEHSYPRVARHHRQNLQGPTKIVLFDEPVFWGIHFEICSNLKITFDIWAERSHPQFIFSA